MHGGSRPPPAFSELGWGFGALLEPTFRARENECFGEWFARAFKKKCVLFFKVNGLPEFSKKVCAFLQAQKISSVLRWIIIVQGEGSPTLTVVVPPASWLNPLQNWNCRSLFHSTAMSKPPSPPLTPHGVTGSASMATPGSGVTGGSWLLSSSLYDIKELHWLGLHNQI